MKVTIKKWGNSASIRIPVAIMEAANIHLDEQVEVREEDGKIIIEPVIKLYKLDDLLAGITDDNLHNSIDFGAPVGKEIF